MLLPDALRRFRREVVDFLPGLRPGGTVGTPLPWVHCCDGHGLGLFRKPQAAQILNSFAVCFLRSFLRSFFAMFLCNVSLRCLSLLSRKFLNLPSSLTFSVPQYPSVHTAGMGFGWPCFAFEAPAAAAELSVWLCCSFRHQDQSWFRDVSCIRHFPKPGTLLKPWMRPVFTRTACCGLYAHSNTGFGRGACKAAS